MLWNFFRRKKKKGKKEVKLGVDLNEINGIIDNNNLFSILKENKKLEEVKDEPKYEPNEKLKGVNMKFLVVLDTSNVSRDIRLENGGTARGLPPALHNFYIVEANDKQQAADLVVWTFRNSPPHIRKQIAYSLKVNPLKNIIDTVHDNYRIWSYIAPKGSVRQPGQQAKIPPQRVNPNNSEEVIPITDPPPPPPVARDDTPPLPKTPTQSFNSEEVDPNNPMAAMAAMMQQMQNMMSQMGQGGLPPPPKTTGFRKVDNPQDDPELMQRMQQVLEGSSQTRRSVGEEFGDDDALAGAERQAQQEVERFKSLPPEQQAAAAQLDIDLNDNSDIDPSQFKNLVGRDSNGPEA